MSAGLLDDIVQSFKRTHGPVSSIISAMLAIAPFLIDPKAHWDIEIRWLVLFMIPIAFSLIFFFTLLDMLIIARKRARNELPKTLAAFEHNQKSFLLIDESDLFVIDGLVSIFHKTLPEIGGAELRIGLGSVCNIQEDKKIQVLILGTEELDSELWKKIRNNDSSVVRAVVVKPFVPHSAILEGRLNG